MQTIYFCDNNAHLKIKFYLQEYAKILFSRAVAYINVDMSVDGTLKYRIFSYCSSFIVFHFIIILFIFPLGLLNIKTNYR